MTTITYFDGQRGVAGWRNPAGVDASGASKIYVVPAVVHVDDTGAILGGASAPLNVSSSSSTLPAGTDRSGTAATSSGTLAADNASRRGLNIQNIGANNLGVNEFGGTAAIGTAGTYTIAPGGSMSVRTNRLITVIAATGATAFTATEF